MARLDDDLIAQLRGHFDKVVRPVVLATSLDDSPASADLEELLEQVASLSEHLTVERRDGARGVPAGVTGERGCRRRSQCDGDHPDPEPGAELPHVVSSRWAVRSPPS